MAVEIQIPSVGESVSEVELGEWLKKEGDSVSQDETLVLLESDKATVELPAPASGVLGKIIKKQGDSAVIGETIAILESAGSAPAKTSVTPPAGSEAAPTGTAQAEGSEAPQSNGASSVKTTPDPGANGMATGTEPPRLREGINSDAPAQSPSEKFVMPAAERVVAQNGLDAAAIEGTGPGGRVLKEDAQRAADANAQSPAPTPPVKAAPASPAASSEFEEVQRMTPLRRTIARRLLEAQQTAALLTTFNEIDMTAVMALRKDNQDTFSKKYGIKLGFMSFFVKASVDALKMFPAVNAEIRGDNIVYKNHYDVGVAIGGGKALVVPVLRNADRMSFAQVEQAINEYAMRVKDGKITPDELIGGTFTITNGGVYGSLLSTPIVNPPQSGILGMHTIQERPIAKNGQVVIAPMMYIALTYDHRIVDGREAVSFLKRIKDCLENPTRMLLEV
ncbi:dihydrolipoyllysine-residue succinyltransferase component of 2-oxoglutarate dehydrogenase complex [Abditibacteriota bacterium]|nr:dihydrolipoyllysine-residue succinyltransferase component of 2-oxoglutarate dehydrogenase complex [Abditibacteriota bacterium]